MSNKQLKQAYSREARRILSELYGETITENELEREESGRPFIRGGNADFNISHSGALVAVSLTAKTQSRINTIELNHHINRTGCDVELVKLRKNAEKIARDSFSKCEYDYIYNKGNIDKTRFYQIWTLKECYIKLFGLSVFDMAKCPSFINSEGRFFNADALCSFYLYELTGGTERYILAAAIEGGHQTPPILRWFSDFTLDCRSIAEIKAAPSPADTQSPKM